MEALVKKKTLKGKCLDHLQKKFRQKGPTTVQEEIQQWYSIIKRYLNRTAQTIEFLRTTKRSSISRMMKKKFSENVQDCLANGNVPDCMTKESHSHSKGCGWWARPRQL